MAFGDEARAKNFGGNPATSDISTSEITQAVAFGDGMVKKLSGKSDWISSDEEWTLVQTASELFASFWIRTHFVNSKDLENLALKHFAQAETICEALASGSEGFVVTTSEYRTQPLNEDAEPYRSSIDTDNDPADVTT